MNSSLDIEVKVKDYFSKKEEVLAVNLFGSYAKGTDNMRSDVDIAILCKYTNIPSGYNLIQWQEDLSELLGKEVDLVCLNTASPILGMQVAQEGKNLLIKDQYKYSQYRMYLFSDYAELKELRAPMERNILNRRYYSES